MTLATRGNDAHPRQATCCWTTGPAALKIHCRNSVPHYQWLPHQQAKCLRTLSLQALYLGARLQLLHALLQSRQIEGHILHTSRHDDMQIVCTERHIDRKGMPFALWPTPASGPHLVHNAFQEGLQDAQQARRAGQRHLDGVLEQRPRPRRHPVHLHADSDS